MPIAYLAACRTLIILKHFNEYVVQELQQGRQMSFRPTFAYFDLLHDNQLSIILQQNFQKLTISGTHQGVFNLEGFVLTILFILHVSI